MKNPKVKDIKTLQDVPAENLFKGGASICAGCPASTAISMATRVLGKDTIFINSSGCFTLLCNYPTTPLKTSWIHNAIENAPATAAGISKVLKVKNRKMNVVCWAGDGATYDIGSQSLLGAIARNDDFIYVCYNNEAFANTGNQWDTATPYGANTKTSQVGEVTPQGNTRFKRYMPLVCAMDGAYSATASIARPFDFMQKLKKAAEFDGVGYIELLSPCVPGWGYPEALGPTVAEKSLTTGFWPLYEIENGILKMNFKPKKREPIMAFTNMQNRFKHLKPQHIKVLQAHVDQYWKYIIERDGKRIAPVFA